MSAIAYYAEALIENESVVISRGLRRRDPDLLDRRIERYQHRLYRYLVFLTRDWQLSEDLFQETWMRVLQKNSQFDPRYRFAGWLLGVARNLGIDEMRRRSPATMAEWNQTDEEEALFDLPDVNPAGSAFVLSRRIFGVIAHGSTSTSGSSTVTSYRISSH